MTTIYVLDTSALIYDPEAYNHFPNSQVVIPIAVLTELDKLKKQTTEAGKKARVAVRLLDKISELGDISTGILLDNRVLLKIDANYIDLSLPEYQGWGDPNYGDTQILACAYALKKEKPSDDVILVSNDINLRVKAKSRGLQAEAHQDQVKPMSDLYSGLQTVIDEETGLALQQSGFLDSKSCKLELSPHECVHFESENGDGIAMGRMMPNGQIKLIKKNYPWGLSSRNKEQAFAIDMIMDKNIDLITLVGRSGTGKSLVAIGACLELVLNKHEYEKLIIYRPIQVVGNEIGYLPGELGEKLAPYFQAIMDSFEVFFTNTSNSKNHSNGNDWKRELEMYQRKGRIELEAIAYIRGRSIPNALILVDEAQQLSKEDVKTILTRAGEGTKIIMNGDLDQIDSPKLDATNNGLLHVMECFKDSPLAGHITFTQGERSRLATVASEIL